MYVCINWVMTEKQNQYAMYVHELCIPEGPKGKTKALWAILSNTWKTEMNGRGENEERDRERERGMRESYKSSWLQEGGWGCGFSGRELKGIEDPST